MENISPTQWLKELKSHDGNKYKIATVLHDLVLTDKPTTEEVKYGGLLYSNASSYTGIFVYTNHVTLEFSEGAKLKDPKGVLQGAGKFRRNIKFTTPDDIDPKVIRNLLKEASKNAKK